MTEQRRSRPLIVAGIDGSPQSKAVLAWAAQQAQMGGARLRVVLAWRLPETFGYESPRVDLELSIAAERVLKEMVADIATMTDVEPVVVEGSAVRVLLNEAREAVLLVLGRHGQELDGGKPVGSVTQACVMQATCPVVVVPT